MIEDKIKLLLKDINDMRQKLKGIKTDMKAEEKIVNDEYIQAKKACKEMREQVKYLEEERMEELVEDADYNKLREMRLKKEEDIANACEQLFKNIAKLPQKAFEMDVETEDGPVKIQAIPDMRVFVNGKEEKKKM